MTRSHISRLSVTTRPNRARLCGLLGILLLGAGPWLHAQNDSGDPPNRVARISLIQGNVSLEPNGVDAFSQAEINYPLTSGDRVYAENNSFGELQTAGLAVRLGNGADVTLSSLTDNIAQFGLAQGSIRVRTRPSTPSTASPERSRSTPPTARFSLTSPATSALTLTRRTTPLWLLSRRAQSK